MIKISSVSVQEKDKNRCNVFVDDEFNCSLSLEIVFKYSIKKGAEFLPETFQEIKKEDNIGYALKKAQGYLAKSLKTKMQVIVYLKGKGFDGAVIFEVIEKLLEYGYIDDVAFAKAYLETNLNQGKKLADFKLMQKGVKKEDIEKARSLIEDNSLNLAVRLAEKRLKNKVITKEIIQKTYNYLLGRGFTFEEASEAVANYLNELGEE